MSTFSHAGVSRLNGEMKVRFCNDALRQKVLIKNGHKDIDIVELKHPMTKVEAVEYLISIDFDNGNKEVRAALEAARDKRAEKPKAAKAKVAKVTAPKAKAAKKPAATAKVEQTPAASTADLEDAPV